MTVSDAILVPSAQSARRHVTRYAWGIQAAGLAWDDIPSMPLGGEAAKRGSAAIDDLIVQGYVSSAIAARGKELIRFLFKLNTVDATIAPDDEGLAFYWAAQEMSLTIIVYQSTYWWSVRNVAGDSRSDEGTQLPLIELEHSLNQFSKEVERRNPEWRSLIR
ncbi:hypothetical protein [Mycobacteroides abscessus]|uniref:hypothetical protein n=1 Tax=Mycobacteroides abscessus TaxID=36809 RepID=UPI0009C6EBBB|nr:hypothetical protein [Mycobacteroides abscessus]SKJ21815.1 Uncharacterised protein [Mycobacteroides abscessus subsp. massiliense]SKJ81950.1 Uncharacterised protein [Mycobacteroides abscessus subsp. massiliense]SKK40980.1 Uncharacterised protein [Mycobacteroides abscessus subsp. massiliense]SKR64577.1 Uncharacterised protein [Mycobacteroides abscessus subsp. massiliense]SKS90360.1 Uncharacterised protein [Mycobacteroides abscessus subsp. massiliense]